jgi:O-Antigen ligase
VTSLPASRPLPANAVVPAALVAVSAAAGLMVALSPQIGSALVLASALFALFFLGLSPTKVFLTTLVTLLAGYLFLGRGFAYFGFGPLYLGEMVLALALVQISVVIWTARLQALHWILLAFMLLGLVRLIPFLGVYGVDALRDSVIWGYALFAIAVSLTIKRDHVSWIHRTLNRRLPQIVLLAAALFAIQYIFKPYLPLVPGSNLPIISIRAGEIAVHLAGMAAFLMLGLYESESKKQSRTEFLMYVVVVVGLLFLSTQSRGAFVTIVVSLLIAFRIRPSARIVRFVAVAVVVAPLLFLFAPKVKLGLREFSAQQLVQNVTSIFSPQEGTVLEGNRSFRTDWWHEIVSYTVKGPYFWGGKGFGINLADSDGFQVNADGSLRSPHNGHMTILARMGVPGFSLWIVFLVAYGLILLHSRRVFLRRGDTLLAGMTAWVLIYSMAALLNACFDVYLEGPQGGIWFWTLAGVGIGLAGLATTSDSAQTAGRLASMRHRLERERSTTSA